LSNATLGAWLNDQEQRGQCRETLLIAKCGTDRCLVNQVRLKCR